MPKNKHRYSVVCKPIHKSRNQFPTLFRWVSLLFIQVCVLLLAVPPHAFARISSLSVTSANGDAIFRGNQDRLFISFTVDEATRQGDGYEYSITADERLIKKETSRNQTVRTQWSGTFGGNLLPDGSYTIRVKVDDGNAENDNDKSYVAVLDSTAPRISSISANADSALLLSERGFIKVPLRSVTVTPDVDIGSPLDVSGNRTNIVIKNEQGATISGFLAYSSATTQLTLSLGNPLDTRSENGNYTVAITLADTAGNTFQSTRSFTFDNVPPNVTALATTSGPLTPGTGVNQQLDFVEVTFTDNLQNGINLSNSTLRLTGPAGEVLGRQTFPTKDTLRWQFLSPLSPRDGLHDGEYTMEIVGTDNAGNQTEAIVVPFLYDNLAPHLVSLSPTQGGQAFNQLGETIYHNQPLTQIVAAFNDGASGTGVAYDRNREGGEKTTYLRFSRSEDGGASEELPGRVFLDTDNTLLTLVLDKPIVSQDGHYILDVQSTDVLGNAERHTFQFLYDTELPTLVSTIPAADETISDLSQIEIKLDEITSGIDFIQSTFRLLDGASVEVPVNITSNGRDAATLTLLQPIALDGSDDGTYTIEVTPTDLAGNTGATARRQFYLVSQSHQPEVRLTMPETSTVNDFTTIVAELINYIGAGIDVDASTLTVTDAQGVPVPQAEVAPDEANNLLTWRPEAVVARDGSADGEYTITATFIDFIGQRFTQAFPIVLDTQFPAIKSVQVATETQTPLSVDSITDIAEIFTQITVAFDEAANDISFDGTTVSLAGPDGADIPLNRLDDGQNVLTLNFQTLAQGGEYVLSITPQDLAGNQSTVPFVYRFRIDVPLPTVSSVVIGGKSGALVYVNSTTASIVATFADLSGVGIALAEGSSTIVVTNADGLTAPGVTTSSGTNQLTWTPIALPTDGSADGRYTVAVTPVDKAGRRGDVVYRQFIYDTESPQITSASPLTLSAPVSYVSGDVSQFVFTVEDVGPADFALESQAIALRNATGSVVPATVTHSQDRAEASAASTLYLTLSSPFAQDGSADGEYTVLLDLVDKAGNRLDSEHTFIYDSQVPRISSVMVNTEPAVALVPGEIADISEAISRITLAFEDATRVDFANTVMTLMGPDDAAIPLQKAYNGKSTLTASFPALRQVGMYTLSVTAQDVAGNVASGAVRYQFALNIALPSVSAVRIGDTASITPALQGQIQYVNARNVRISAEFSTPQSGANTTEAPGTGLLLGEGGSSIVVTNASGDAVPGQTRPNGTDGLIWEPVSLPTDGSADGRYTVAVTPVDKAGRQGDVVYRQFIYDTESPQITSASPLTLSAPVSYVSGDVRQFVFTVEDVGPADFVLESQTIALRNATGSVVPATVTHSQDRAEASAASTLYLTLSSPFAQDGSADGEYTVLLDLVDKAGNRLDSEHTFIYDSQVPQLSTVTLNTEPALPSGGWELVPGEIADISEAISRITLAFEDATRVDFANTQITLMGPDDAAIPLQKAHRMSTITASFPALRQVGMYTLSVIAQDVAGNVASGAVRYQFALNIALPSVSAVIIGEQTGDVGEVSHAFSMRGEVFVNAHNVRISATFVEAPGTGLLLGEGGSSIVVTNASGDAVPGQTRGEGVDQLIWEPVSLPTDGSADGRYTVAVTPVDKAGRQGDVVYRQFIYDTESPQITSASPLTLSAPVSYVSGDVSQFVFTVEDVGPADFSNPQSGVNTLTQAIELRNATGSVVPATVTHTQDRAEASAASTLYLTLSSPFAQDGSADGEYTVLLGLVDQAGNRLDSEHTFIYDSQVPRLSAVMVNAEQPVVLEPQQVTEFSESVSTITLQFEEATRMDFANTQITLMGPDPSGETDESGAPVESEIPLTLQDDGASQVTVSFLELTQIGSYTLSVTPQDIAGNVASGAVNYRFVLDIPLPSVSSVIIGEQTGDVVYVNASNMLIGAILLDPTETGLAFGSEGSRITVTEYGATTIVRGATSSNGTDLLVWEPIGLTSDGTTDGRYSVYVTPIDKAGRQGSIVYREFVYDTQEPEIIAAELIDLSQPVSYISQSLTQLHFTVADVGPAELDVEDQKVSLRDASGSLVPAQLTDDTETQLFLTLNQPLPLDGSMDGEYTVVVELSDKAGNTFNVEHLIVYDTQAPTLVSTVPADGALSTEDITQVQVNLSDEGSSGIDWTATTVSLIGPGAGGENGSEISGELVSNGTTQLILNTNQLVEDGRYIIRVQAVDRAGNGNATVFERSFLLSRRLPAIVSTSPSTAPEDEAFTNEEIERIEVTLETDDENHLSTLRLLNAESQVIAGQQQRESDRLIYNLVRPLATDGSEDDIYTIEFTPISASGRQGQVQQLSFVYDTQAPEIEPEEAIHLVVAQPEVNNSLIEIRVNLTDNQSGIDWENLDEEWLTFERLSPDATEIAGRVDDDNQGNLTFRLTVPLADNGSADGEYRITVVPKDRAGNGDEPYQRVFTYDTSPPTIDASTLLINDAPLLVDINATDYPTAVSATGGVAIQANIFDTGLGVNLAQSRIIVRNPDGTEISGNTQQNGVDTLLFKSDGLTTQGLYQVTVISIGNDSELLGFAPTDSITTEFLYETTEPTATVTSDGGETELTDEALPLEGTAADPAGTVGDRQIQASGVWLVEIVGEGPDRQPIDPVPAIDDSNAEEEPWSRWSVDFLPSRSGEYDLDVRVTDNAGNYAVYDIGEYTMSVSLTFRGTTFGWPNPLRLSKGDVAFFSFDVNVPLGETVELTLSIYDWGGDIVLSQTYPDVVSGQRNDQLIKWNLENQAGTPVARGLYVFRLEAVNATGNSANAVGKVLVVD